MRLKPLVDPGPELTRDQVQRYSRHLLLGPLGHEGQRRLLASRVAVMGAGGLGAPVLQYLAAAGVGHLTIIDDDVVEPSNLQRQVIHTMADVGRPKVESAAAHVRALNPEVQVSTHHGRLEADNARDLLGGHHVVLDGTDNFPTRYLVSDTCAELGIPVVWGSILRFDAQVSVFWSRPAAAHDETPAPPGVTLRDLFPMPPPEGTTPSCGQAGVLGAMCGQVGSVMATEAVKLLTGTGEPLLGRVLVLDALAQRWSELPVRPRPHAAPAPTPVAADGEAPSDDLPAITAAGLAARLDARARGTDDFVLLDVREAPERGIVAIPGAVNVPLGDVLADPQAVVHRLDLHPPGGVARELLVHCRSGQRSAQAVRALTDAGARAVDVRGGVLAWVADVDPDLPTY
ncbi:ThiF family adenylyltransferase [Georgenia alba]|uniref:ThiF family adenylyltransferase n=1 Tax=Georgenia alba TaxID=2233858 RepID=A0ABW2Q5E2_9MICO